MFVKNDVRVGLKDIGISNKATNKAILGMLEDVAGFHSDIAGGLHYGTDIGRLFKDNFSG